MIKVQGETRSGVRDGSKGNGSRIAGRGELAELIRARDWASTPLGAVEGWTSALVTTVGTMLASPVPTALFWGPELVMLYNDAYRPITGVKHPACLGQPGRDVWSETWEVVGPEMIRVMETEQAIARRNVLIPINRRGTIEDFYWDYSFSAVYDGGRVAGIYNQAQDKTREVVTESQLGASEARLERMYMEMRAIYETASVALAMIDPVEFRYVRGNPKLARILNVPVEDLIGMPVFDLANDVQGLREALETAAAGMPVTGKIVEGEISNTPGLKRAWQVEYIPVFGSDGRVEMIVASSIEITDQRMLEHALMQNEKLASVGRLAASIAHEINNPLDAVTNLMYLAESSENLSEVREYLGMAAGELRRVSAISQKTLKFNRHTSGPREVRSADLVDEVLALYQGRVGNTGVMVERRERVTRMLHCFDGEIRQVLSNLIGNGIDAMQASGGRLMVRSREGTEWGSGAKGLRLVVADEGSGMSAATLARVFDAFFSTKGEGGTGLGLWITREIVDRHKGSLRVRSRQVEGGGWTVFTLFLPWDGVEPGAWVSGGQSES